MSLHAGVKLRAALLICLLAAGRASAIESVPGGTLVFAGMTLQEKDGRIQVEELQSGSPAERAGVLPLDVLLVVGDLSLVDLQPVDLETLRRVLRNTPDGELRLVLGRGAGTLHIMIDTTPADAPRRPPPVRRTPVKTGEPAPLFSGTDLRGQEVSLAALQGGPVLIDFWASWCPPCKANALVLRRIAAAHAETLRVVGVGLDDDRKAWEAFIYNQHLPGLQLLDGRSGPIGSRYGIAAAGIPFVVVVDGTGRIVAAGNSIADLEGEIDRLLTAPRGDTRPVP